MTTPPVSIIVLQWNQLDLTKRCVASLRENSAGDHQLILVDNGSEPEAAKWAATTADTSVLLDSNHGFAKGMNAGLAVAHHDFVAFVNNDTEFPPDWDKHLTESVTMASTGVTAPAVTNGGNVSSVRSEAGSLVRIARPFVDLPSGVVYLMRSDYIRALGGWQEDYNVASSEDLDLLFAVWVTTRDVCIDDRVLVKHVGSATAASQLPERSRIWRENRNQFASLWMAMDEPTFRSRYDWSGPVDPGRLEQARIAAYWMSRFFAEADGHLQTRREMKARLASITDRADVPTRRSPLWRRSN